MGAMSPWHWAIVALVVVILFGSKKLPDAARGLGRSLRIFKSEVKEMQNDDARSAAPQQPQVQQPLPPVQQQPQPVEPTVVPPQQQTAPHSEPRSY
ncbi:MULTISPECIES: Sec-independent protein translocase subunit TatA [unclassified Rhodococcus (in: high G+C Gram-positive bacteria)]|uniref:Sec-independent protein translocase subunit TatA n=1 Tax=unclassified Rhodococcus (in: high G+C Gram-positive bacteria) TaxID=192944 RepID=UPI00146A05CA|nr:Sec-independent protein translocase subunit TatA [Rhodococcus sp. BL-253-APC-6A1W]NMD96980.1 Sec-independent protein translocase subunit TatA [Rhodococcus sp. BL-253-APC-6A1W]